MRLADVEKELRPRKDQNHFWDCALFHTADGNSVYVERTVGEDPIWHISWVEGLASLPDPYKDIQANGKFSDGTGYKSYHPLEPLTAQAILYELLGGNK
jgi:hypothetical protein